MLAVIILGAGLALSTISALAWAAGQRLQGRRAFAATAATVSATVGTLVRGDAAFVGAVRTVLAMSPQMSPSTFDRWYRRLAAAQLQAGGTGTLVLTPVPARRLARFERRRDRDRVFARLMGRWREPVAPAPASTYCLVSAGHPAAAITAPLAAAVQGDWCQPGSPIGAAEPAMLRELTDTGRYLVESVRLPWLDTSFFETAFYRPGARVATVAQRRTAVSGWLLSSFDLDAIVAQAIGSARGLTVDISFTEPDGRAARVATGASAGAAIGGLTETSTVAVDGRWTVAVHGSAVVDGMSATAEGELVFLIGASLSLLLALVMFTLSHSRARALALVEEKAGELRHRALYDTLTGLPNRVLALDRAEQMLARARRTPLPIAAFYIDIDGFKHINDSFGHATGDRFLQMVAARLLSVVRDSDTAGRLAGDEFIILLEGSPLDAGPELVAERVLDVLREPYDLTGEIGRELTVGASIGIAYGQRAGAEELLADADVALHAAKDAGRNCYVQFRSGMQTAAYDRITLEMDLARAIEADELFLVYQPTFDLRSERPTGVEALLRWRHPERGIVAPDLFIPIAERGGLIVAVGRWVLERACRQAADWHARGHELSIAVNVSGRQLDHDRLVDDVRAALATSGLRPSHLTLEITETALMRDPDATARRLSALKQLGVRIAIDDFGTGYSSLAYLRQFPVDTLKIDRSFVQATGGSPESVALIHTLIDLGKALNLETVGEGIEDRDQLELLQRAGCDSGQGFLFTRPLEIEALSAFLDARAATVSPVAVG
ncbi:MAG: bifunctional diguanylate cyclase/phosphodiesterase [Solirubrobacteraceae bacterium]